MILGRPGKKVIKIVIPYNNELKIIKLGSKPQRAIMLAKEVSLSPHPDMLIGTSINTPIAGILIRRASIGASTWQAFKQAQ